MSFLALPFLLATLAAAIPVVLHMINRQKVKDLPFSTLRFLRISVEKTRRRRRIHDLLLMLVRAAALILIALALAKPTLTSLSALWGGGGDSAVAIVLDNSASMGTIDQGRVRFRTALAAAEQIMDELSEGDRVALLLTGGPELPPLGKLDRTHEMVRQILGQWTEAPSPTGGVTYQRADLALKIQQAQKLLAKTEAANKQIYVLTDLQKLCFDALEPETVTGANRERNQEPTAEEKKILEIPLIFVDCNRAPKPNVAITDVDLKAAMPVAGQPVVAAVELFNASSVAQQRHLELYVDGAKKATSAVLNLPPGERLTEQIEFVFERSGLRRGEVLLVGEDGSKLDDRRFFAMEVDQGIPVAVVKARQHEIPYLEDTFYLERALAPGKSGNWAIRLTTLTADDLQDEPLSTYKVVFCVNLPAPPGDAAGRLRTYVTGGGNLVWICGGHVDAEAYNRMNQQAGRQLLPLPLVDVRTPEVGGDRDSWNIGFFDKEHPALRHLVEPASLYRSVLIYKHVRMATQNAADARILARLDDEQGEPLLVQRNVEQGKVLMLGTSAHVGWSNLPLRPIFLPLLARLTFHLAGAEQARHQTLAGSPLVWRLEDKTPAGIVEIRPPIGEPIRRPTADESDEPSEVFRYDDTYEVGIYQMHLLQAARPAQIAYAVNLDPDEADPEKIDREELQRRFGGTSLVFAEDPDDLSGTFALLREGKSLWELFLSAVLIVLVFETFLANRLSPKQEEDQGEQPPPGMRRLAKRGRGAA